MKNLNNQVLIVSSEFPPGPGGIGDHAFNLAKQLSDNSFKVSVLTEFRNEFSNDWKGDRTATYNLVYLSRRLPFFSFRFFIRFFILVISKRFNLIIASGQKSIILVGVLSFISQQKAIAVIHGHEVGLGPKINSLLIQKLLDSFSALVAVSEFSKSIVIKYLKNKNIVHVIPNGFDDTKFSNIDEWLTRSQSILKLLTVGRISRRKGQYRVVELLPALIENLKVDIQYHVVGIDYERKRILDHAKRFGVEKNLFIHGVLPNSLITQHFNEANIFIMLSENTSDGDVEGFGIAIIEANYFGLPSIGSKGCGIEQSICNGYNGFLVDSKDVNALVLAIKTILENYDRFRLDSREWATRHLWSKVIIKYIELFNLIDISK